MCLVMQELWLLVSVVTLNGHNVHMFADWAHLCYSNKISVMYIYATTCSFRGNGR